MSNFAARLHRHDGGPVNFGPDEADPGDILSQPRFSTEQGGFGSASFVLSRPDNLTSLDSQHFADVVLYDALTGQTAYEGRIKGTPRVGVNEVSVECEGWAQHLADNKAFRRLWIDRDLSRWEGPSLARQLALIAGATKFRVSEGNVDTQPPNTLKLAVTKRSTPVGIAEAWYDAQGLSIGKLTADDYLDRRASTNGAIGVGWSVTALLSTDDVATSSNASSNLQGTSSPFTVTASGDAKKHAAVAMAWAGTPDTTEDEWMAFFEGLAVHGDHGLTYENGGYRLDEVIVDLIRAGAPKLHIGDVDFSSYYLPHAVYLDATTPLAILEELSVFAGQMPDWGVYENREFFWRKPGQGRTWRLRRDEAVDAEDEGPDSSERLNGVVVLYDPGDGSRRSVGPPGSNADIETDFLVDASEDNPFNQAGINRWDVRDVGITSPEGALILGRLILDEANTIRRRGEGRVSGTVTDASGAEWPAWMIRAHDTVIVEDDDDPMQRRVYETDVEGDDVNIAYDSNPHRLDTLLARLGAIQLA